MPKPIIITVRSIDLTSSLVSSITIPLIKLSMHRDPANLEDSSSDVVPPCANTALMEAEKADRLKEQLTLQSGYLAGTEPYLITSRFVAYAAFECAKEPIAMYLAVRIFVDNIDMNGPLLTFGDRLPETVGELVFITAIYVPYIEEHVPSFLLCLDVDKFTEAFPNDSATGRLPDPNDWCILNFGDHFNSLIAGPTQSSCCNDADHHKKALQTFIGHFMAIKASGDHDYDRILLLRGLMPDNQPELADGNQIMAAMGVSTGIDSSSAVDTDSDLEAMLDVEIAKVKKPRASRSKAAIVEDIKRSPRIASKAIVIMGLGDDEAGGKLPTDGEVSLQPYRGKTSKLAKTKISKQTLKTPISSGKQQKLTGSKSTGAKVSVTKLSRPATVVAAAEVTAGGNCETARTSTPKPPTAATPALTTMAGSGLTHASFMQQNYDALNFGNAQIDSFLFRAERYVR